MSSVAPAANRSSVSGVGGSAQSGSAPGSATGSVAGGAQDDEDTIEPLTQEQIDAERATIEQWIRETRAAR